jgi:hypothetical protein
MDGVVVIAEVSQHHFLSVPVYTRAPSPLPMVVSIFGEPEPSHCLEDWFGMCGRWYLHKLWAPSLEVPLLAKEYHIVKL